MALKQIARNTLIQLIGRLLSAAISFLITFLLARALGPAFFGDYIKIITLVTLFYFLADLGLNAFFLKDLAEESAQAPTLLRHIFGLRLLLGVLGSIGG